MILPASAAPRSTAAGRTPAHRLRIAQISTPRAGNNWLRHLLAGLFDLPTRPVHSAHDLDWETFPAEGLLAIHWHPTPAFLDRLRNEGFQIVVLARHPLDVLISVLHFALYYADSNETQRWLGGEDGNERCIFGAMPRSTAFLDYATGKRAGAILSVSQEWWNLPGCLRVRYEDLLEDPQGTLERLADALGTAGRQPIAQVLADTSMVQLRQSTGSKFHFWQGKSGLWRSLLPEVEATRIAEAHQAVLDDLGYQVDPDPALDGGQADANWIKLLWSELAADLAQLKTNNLQARKLRATEEQVVSVQAELADSRSRFTEFVGRFTAVQQQLLNVQATYQDMVEKLAAANLALGEVQTRHALAQQAAALAESQLHELRQSHSGLQAELLQARQAQETLAAEFRRVSEKHAQVADLGPSAIRVARALRSWSLRFPRLTRLVRWSLINLPSPPSTGERGGLFLPVAFSEPPGLSRRDEPAGSPGPGDGSPSTWHPAAAPLPAGLPVPVDSSKRR
jgi:Sulfotransferase domain